jgi:uncharacterized protein YndB with AHSA1/START domain
MAAAEDIILTVSVSVNAPVEKVWKHWTSPASITGWNNASDDWHTLHATNDLRKNGKFSYRMEAKDGSIGFDFGGIYDNVILHSQIDSTLGDGRKVSVIFSSRGNNTEVVESFQAENTHSLDMQRKGWQAILDNFKKYTESEK